MSGGSYDYLCYVETEDVFAHYRIQNLVAIKDRLVVLGHEDAARNVQSLIRNIRLSVSSIGEQLDLLRGVLKAVEWLDSADYGEDQVAEAVEALGKMPATQEEETK